MLLDILVNTCIYCKISQISIFSDYKESRGTVPLVLYLMNINKSIHLFICQILLYFRILFVMSNRTKNHRKTFCSNIFRVGWTTSCNGEIKLMESNGMVQV